MKRTITIIMIALIVIVAMAGCAAKPTEKAEPAASGPVETEKSEEGIAPIAEKINAESAKNMIDASGVTIVDVRSAEEYASGHVPGAILAPLDKLADDAETLLPDKDATLLVYCRSGNRSAQAVSLLQQLGYTRLYDFGGIINWPYETEKSQ